jgi:hypothetical protein
MNPGSGPYTASLVAGGLSSPSRVALTETWNGSSWTETGDLNTARSQGGGASNGTTTATIVFAGGVPTVQTVAETWDGSSWTEVGDVNTARYQLSGALQNRGMAHLGRKQQT